VPEGVAGELYLGGAGVARGYLNQPELSRERFLPNPHGHGLLYRSGDLGRYRPDGLIEYLGRADNQVKIRGYRVDPGEIETLLSRCPGVREAVVVAPEDGHGHKRLAAYVVAEDAAAAAALTTRWKPFLQARLPAYMLPASLSVLERLPLTPSGKVDRRQLEQSRPSSNPPSAAPALGNALERRIAAIWQSLLGLDAIDSHDNFFDVGGHSLLLVQLHERLQQELDLSLSVTDLFRYPSIASLAAHLNSTRAGEPGKSAAEQARAQARRAALQRAGRRRRE
jgi:acyl carrier protein